MKGSCGVVLRQVDVVLVWVCLGVALLSGKEYELGEFAKVLLGCLKAMKKEQHPGFQRGPPP